MPVEDRDIPGLVYWAERLRAETHGCRQWDRPGTETIFARELKGMNLGVALELVLAHARDPEAKTPAAIKRQFKPAVTLTEPEPPRCTEHPDELAPPFCRIHKTDHIRAYNDPAEVVVPLAKDTAIKAARTAAGYPIKTTTEETA